MGLQSDADNMDPKAKANQSIRWYETIRMQPGGFLDVEEDYGEGQSRQVCEFKYGFELRMRDEYDRAKVCLCFGLERTHAASSGRRQIFSQHLLAGAKDFGGTSRLPLLCFVAHHKTN